MTADFGNPFVGYLNSLIRLSGGNENALAEFQARNPQFPLIHVEHPLTARILQTLQQPDGPHVILTGHAGDGKSTIALDVFRRLTGLKDGALLTANPKPREDLPSGISILKDLSERQKDEDAVLLRTILTGERRFLIVSNTGALLDFFRDHTAVHGVSATKIESDVLTAISAQGGTASLLVSGASFLVVNLALVDNLALARKIFLRMLDVSRWAHCEGVLCRTECPIYNNVALVNANRERVLDRLFLAYRRMYEYGTRLTLRQITEHLAYLVTSGLEEADVAEMRARTKRHPPTEFAFFNRFFGDNGRSEDISASQMRAIREIRHQGFGGRPCPTWERKLWLKLRDANFALGVDGCDREFDVLRSHGAGDTTNDRADCSPDQAREQVRRMLYFLYDFPLENQAYLSHFLNSPTVLQWHKWQQPGSFLEMAEKNLLEQRVFHVLQEHFTGVRLPEGMKAHDHRLFITLGRGIDGMRQSAQVVVAQVDWSSEITLQLVSRKDVAGGDRTDLELQGRGRLLNTTLVLTLPFLDYVLMRHFGDVGEALQAAYVERLNRLKAQIQSLAPESGAHLMLVRLKSDHTFRRQQYTVRDGKLEVNDAI